MKYQNLNRIVNKKTVVLILIAIILFYSVVLTSWFFRNYSSNATFLFSEAKRQNGELAKFLATVIAGILGFITIWLNYVRTDAIQKQTNNQLKQIEKITEQNELIRKSKIDERFKNAIEHLGSDNPAVSLGGIHALHRVTEEDDSYCSVVVDILCSFIREKSIHNKDFNDTSKRSKDLIKTKFEFQTIIDLLFKEERGSNCNYGSISANLNSIKCFKGDFCGAKFHTVKLNDTQLVKCNFTKTIFSKAELCRANFKSSDLRFTKFEDTHLNSANLQKSYLLGVTFRACNLKKANFLGVDIQGTSIFDSDLSNAHFEASKMKKVSFNGSSLRNSHFEGAELLRIHFEFLDLENAHFEGAYISNAHFEGAYLRNAHFEGAFIEGAHFEGADLTGAHFEGTYTTDWINDDHNENFCNRVGQDSQMDNIKEGILTQESIESMLLEFRRKIKNKDSLIKYESSLGKSINRETKIVKEAILGKLTKEKADEIIQRCIKRTSLD